MPHSYCEHKHFASLILDTKTLMSEYLKPLGCQIVCYPTMISWICGSLILQEIMALS